MSIPELLETPAKLSASTGMVIPGKRRPAPHGVQGEARPGIQLFPSNPDSRFPGLTEQASFAKGS
jgi:hypothetical protein